VSSTRAIEKAGTIEVITSLQQIKLCQVKQRMICTKALKECFQSRLSDQLSRSDRFI
jgi:hypothetical protein